MSVPNTCSGFPVFENPPLKYSAEQILHILLDPDFDQQRICRQKPFGITRSGTFVVDLSSLDSEEDIKEDEFGIWNYSGSHPKAYRIHKCNDILSFENVSINAKGPNVMFLRRLHCTHPSNAGFKRLICFLSGTCVKY